MQRELTSLELCAGAGGQALGLEQAGFVHQACVEIDDWCKQTLFANRPQWNILNGDQSDLLSFDPRPFKDVDLVAGGVPCPPFSKAGKQLGAKDERDLFPAALDIVSEIRPKAVMLENVRGFLDPVFEDYRVKLKTTLISMGYSRVEWRLLNASDYGVSQLRPRVVIVALQRKYADCFSWPQPNFTPAPSVGECLADLMSARGWCRTNEWIKKANTIAPTIVGGSKKHGGPDLGPTRAKKAWELLGVNGKTIAENAPEASFEGLPRLTVRMVARLQGFPDDWTFAGRKTASYRQVGNAFPPPVARAVATQLHNAITEKQLFAVAS